MASPLYSCIDDSCDCMNVCGAHRKPSSVCFSPGRNMMLAGRVRIRRRKVFIRVSIGSCASSVAFISNRPAMANVSSPALLVERQFRLLMMSTSVKARPSTNGDGYSVPNDTLNAKGQELRYTERLLLTGASNLQR